MILGLKRNISQVIALSLLGFLSAACTPKAEFAPPVESPLSRSVLGYGVVSVSYTQIKDEPSRTGINLGYVRENTILTVLERRFVREGDSLQYWLLIEGDYQGWLPESVLTVYETKGKAQTAADSRQ